MWQQVSELGAQLRQAQRQQLGQRAVELHEQLEESQAEVLTLRSQLDAATARTERTERTPPRRGDGRASHRPSHRSSHRSTSEAQSGRGAARSSERAERPRSRRHRSSAAAARPTASAQPTADAVDEGAGPAAAMPSIVEGSSVAGVPVVEEEGAPPEP